MVFFRNCHCLNHVALLFFGKSFGFSSNLRTLCTLAGAGKKVPFFDFDWKAQMWNILFLIGAVIGGYLSATILKNDQPIQIANSTIIDLKEIGIVFDGQLALAPCLSILAMVIFLC